MVLSEIIDYVGWSRRHTALHYLQLTKVLNPAGALATLAVTETDALTGWQDINELKRFACAFPPNTPEKWPCLK